MLIFNHSVVVITIIVCKHRVLPGAIQIEALRAFHSQIKSYFDTTTESVIF